MAAGGLTGLWDKNSSEANTDSQRSSTGEQEAGAGAFVKAEKAEKAVFGGIATGHDSTGRLPHLPGEEQHQCKDRTRRPQLHRTGDLYVAKDR